jgi:hypothetical protein
MATRSPLSNDALAVPLFPPGSSVGRSRALAGINPGSLHLYYVLSAAALEANFAGFNMMHERTEK